MEITKDIRYIGVNDHEVDLFEGQYAVPDGMAYNSYLILDEKTAGTVIAYTSVYGHTKEAAELLAQRLRERGCPKVVLNDLARTDMAEAVEDAFRYEKLVLATTTYNGDVFPFVKTFIHHLTERGYRNRTVALIENGSWAPTAARIMKGMMEGCKNITWADTAVSIRSALNGENREQIDALARELTAGREA